MKFPSSIYIISYFLIFCKLEFIDLYNDYQIQFYNFGMNILLLKNKIINLQNKEKYDIMYIDEGNFIK